MGTWTQCILPDQPRLLEITLYELCSLRTKTDPGFGEILKLTHSVGLAFSLIIRPESVLNLNQMLYAA